MRLLLGVLLLAIPLGALVVLLSYNHGLGLTVIAITIAVIATLMIRAGVGILGDYF